MTVRGRPCFVRRRVSSHHFRQSASHLLRSRALTPSGRPSVSQSVSQSVRCLSMDEGQVNETLARAHTHTHTHMHIHSATKHNICSCCWEGYPHRVRSIADRTSVEEHNQSINQSTNQPTNQPNRRQGMVEPPTSRSCRRAVTVLPMWLQPQLDSPNESRQSLFSALTRSNGSPFSWGPAQSVRFCLGA